MAFCVFIVAEADTNLWVCQSEGKGRFEVEKGRRKGGSTSFLACFKIRWMSNHKSSQLQELNLGQEQGR